MNWSANCKFCIEMKMTYNSKNNIAKEQKVEELTVEELTVIWSMYYWCKERK